MIPVNSKSLLAFVFQQMEKLDKNEISNEQAIAQAKLASQANNILNYELKRTVVELRLKEIGTTLLGHAPTTNGKSAVFTELARN